MSGLILPASQSIVIPMDELALETRQKNHIKNCIDRRAPTAGKQKQVDDWIKEYQDCTHRTRAPCQKYNCHGLTFAARRTAIEDPSVVQQILNEDKYTKISRSEVKEGDIAIWRRSAIQGGEIEHSGVVVGFRASLTGGEQQPLILSKWGSAHELIHPVTRSPYKSSLEYYRLYP